MGFMSELQLVARALHKITGAVKINYEMHANSAPHKSVDEFKWFVEQMRKELSIS